MRDRVTSAGGSGLGQIATVELSGGRSLKVVYMKDPEGNIIELQQMA